MNLILFTVAETAEPLAKNDPRAQHLLSVLRRKPGDTFDAGLINGPRGKGKIDSVDADVLRLSFAWDAPLAPLDPLILILGLPRPQTARDLLREATTLGATAVHFVSTERSDPNYASSSLWSSGEWRRHCLQGAEQAFDTRIPEVTWTGSLEAAIAALPATVVKVALDNYEATSALGACPALETSAGQPVSLAFGPERGWSDADRTILRRTGFILAHLGQRVLRAETAMVAGVSILRSRRGQM